MREYYCQACGDTVKEDSLLSHALDHIPPAVSIESGDLLKMYEVVKEF